MRFIVVPYRDGYFYNSFGPAVRDLQIIELLSRKFDVTVINRPVSLYERFVKRYSKGNFLNGEIEIVDNTSFDFIGPLRGRSWALFCYRRYVEKVLEKYAGEQVIFVDFSPFANFEFLKEMDNIIYWHDMIDNFSIHNRFSTFEKKEVLKKYHNLQHSADFVTAVSSSALSNINIIKDKKQVLPNGIFESASESLIKNVNIDDTVFDFGFLGFITNKLDVDFINTLSEKYSVCVWGKCFDPDVLRKLSNNVKYFGKFKYKDILSVMSSFKVGLLPYKPELLHDESPLKMYEYFKYNKPCLASVQYELESKYYRCYSGLSEDELGFVLDFYLNVSGSVCISDEIEESWKLEFNLDAVIKKILNKSSS